MPDEQETSSTSVTTDPLTSMTNGDSTNGDSTNGPSSSAESSTSTTEASSGSTASPSACGDGVVDADEECDEGEANAPGGTCRPGCVLAGCGDGEILVGVETCDSKNFGDHSCRSLGFDGGALVCDEACSIDTSGCHACGDGAVVGPEACDGGELGGATCASVLGPQFHGTPACDAACALAVAGCFECGDGVLDPGESCDGEALGGSSCVGMGFDGGTLACDAWCGWESSGCHQCGNGVREADEACDGNDFGSETCLTLVPNPVYPWIGGGDLACDASCAVDVSGCSVCGNGLLEPGEECDGDDFGGQSCAELHPTRIAGTPLCSPFCSGLHEMAGCCIPSGNSCHPLGNNVCCVGGSLGCWPDLLMCG